MMPNMLLIGGKLTPNILLPYIKSQVVSELQVDLQVIVFLSLSIQSRER